MSQEYQERHQDDDAKRNQVKTQKNVHPLTLAHFGGAVKGKGASGGEGSSEEGRLPPCAHVSCVRKNNIEG